MVQIIIACAMVVILCIVSSNVLYKLGVPTLLIFLALGMLCGSDAIGGIYFDNYEIAKNVCSVGLVFIMFFGGFGTSWKTAKPVTVMSARTVRCSMLRRSSGNGRFKSELLRC